MTRFWRVAEVFGPTIQGEGRQAGLPCYFIRFGGCDLRCSWCDTPHAVLPEMISQLPKQDIEQILARLDALEVGPEWVVISGGNPATLKLEDLVDELHASGLQVMVETQGTVFNDWLNKVDELCVSPKPPSSGNTVTHHDLVRFFNSFNIQNEKVYLKVVVFDDDDYEYAKDAHHAWPNLDFFLSAGNEDPSLPTVGNPYPVPGDYEWEKENEMTTLQVVTRKMRWLFEKVSHDPEMSDVRVLPQLHTLAWGNERGR